MSHDLVVRNARLTGADERTDLAVNDGKITVVGPVPGPGRREIDAEGGLVAGGFVDPHVHLDKALLADDLPANESRTLGEAIRLDTDRKRGESVEAVRERAERAIELHVEHGCTRLRTHVDVDPVGELTALQGVLAAREACADIADVQVVAFPQNGLHRAPGTEALLAEALEHDVDAVGAIPAIERTEDAVKGQVDTLLSLAAEYDVELDAHVDETDDPTARSLEYLAARALDTDVPVTVGHACALAAYDETHAGRVIDLVAEADLTVITSPGTNMLLQGRDDRHPKRRGLTRIDQLRAAGVTIAAGQDNIRDAFYKYNRGDMLETAYLVAHAAHLQAPAERRAAWRMVTENAASVMGVEHGVQEEYPAVFNVFPPAVSTPTDALRERIPPRAVVHHGSVVAETTLEKRLHREQ